VDRIRRSAGRSSRSAVLQALGLPQERPVVGQVGSVGDSKGQHITVEAFRRQASLGGLPPYSLVFLGRCPTSHRHALEKMLAGTSPPWQEAVAFAEYDPDDFALWSAIDILVHPSILPDPFPNAVREAMILGKAVIASRVGGIPEMIQHGETGLLVEPGSPDELGDAILRLLRDPDGRRHLGTRAEAYACNYLDIERCKWQFLTLFQKLIQSRSRGKGRLDLSRPRA
jgi:glycosyltransferase involved in cell wall biosynthesis